VQDFRQPFFAVGGVGFDEGTVAVGGADEGSDGGVVAEGFFGHFVFLAAERNRLKAELRTGLYG